MDYGTPLKCVRSSSSKVFSPVAEFSLQSESPAANQSTIQSNLFIQQSTAEYVKYNVK